MVTDYYEWSKEHIRYLYEKIQNLKNDGLKTSPGDIWSVKKLLVLDYYLGAFVKIIRNPKWKFKNWYYVDPFCGSGLIKFKEDLKDERFPGSPMVAALRATELPFTDYLLSDIDKDSIKALDTRFSANKTLVGNRKYEPKVMDFASSVRNVEDKKQFGNAFLIFIDPTGYKDIKWELMERLLKIETADIILTFMTSFIALNRSKADSDIETAKSLDELFGNTEWTNCRGGEELLSLYRKRMETTGKKTYVIGVFMKGESKLYDMILATRSTGGGKVVESATKIMESVTTELIHSSFEVVSEKRTEITEFM
jgi:three-Cys-motif partner protein